MPETASGPVALAGATGFIGQHVQNALLTGGYSVRALIRAGSRRAAVNPRCEVAVLSLDDRHAVHTALTGVRALVYCAGTVRGRTWSDFEAANVRGVEQVAGALAGQDPAIPLLLISSLAASAPELSLYAGSKAAGEQALRHSGHPAWSVLRPPAVYGPGDPELTPVFRAIRLGLVPVMDDARQRLPFIEVSDLARAVSAWLEHAERCNGGVYAIHDGTRNGYDWREIAERVRSRGTRSPLLMRIPFPVLEALGHVNCAFSRVAGYQPMLTPGKARELTFRHWHCCNRAFTDATGWTPEVCLAQGAARLFG